MLAALSSSELDRLVIGGVAGCSRSSKNALAHAVLRASDGMGGRCRYVKLDDWIVPLKKRTPSMSAQTRNGVELRAEMAIQGLWTGRLEEWTRYRRTVSTR